MFTQVQLALIEFAARKTKNQGELAVAKYVDEKSVGDTFTEQQRNIIQYCAEECKRQRSGEMSVYDMVNAWNWAMVPPSKIIDYRAFSITPEFIEKLGKIVEPIDNAKGFRTVPIGIWDGFTWLEKAQWAEVPRLLRLLLESYYEDNLGQVELGPNNVFAFTAEDQFYYEYEQIHPFFDGNGRSGKILYNYLRGTLDNPVMPPNFWGGNNP